MSNVKLNQEKEDDLKVENGEIQVSEEQYKEEREANYIALVLEHDLINNVLNYRKLEKVM